MRNDSIMSQSNTLLSTPRELPLNSIKINIERIQRNCRCIICGDKNVTVNPVISEESKLAQKE